MKKFKWKRPKSFGISSYQVDGKRTIRVSVWWWLILVIVAGAVVTYIVFLRPASELLSARRDFDATVKAVGKLYELPNEVPVLATVTEKEKLASQPFFDLAENGDKVLVFNTARKVIIYRPRTKKIINFASLNPSELPVTTPP